MAMKLAAVSNSVLSSWEEMWTLRLF